MLTLIGVLAILAGDADVSEIRSDEQVVFFPTIGYSIPGQTVWLLQIHGWIYEPAWEDAGLTSLQSALGLASTQIGQVDSVVFAERARWFLVDNERGKRLAVRLGDKTYVMEKSAPNGHFHGRVRLPSDQIESLRAGLAPSSRRLSFQAVTPKDRKEKFVGEIHLVGEEGISVISDIDDTIKVSEVTDRKKLLKNTFLLPFREVRGMSEVYKGWAQGNSVSFHYASASPWQLYVPLQEFMTKEGFPAGTFHLKSFRWKDRSFLSVFESPMDYKLGVIEPILDRFPKRRFLLVGDSGEKDPEVYGVLARKYGRQILGILIRDVTGEPPGDPRYHEAFKDLPPTAWRVFRDPVEIRDALP